MRFLRENHEKQVMNDLNYNSLGKTNNPDPLTDPLHNK